MNLKKDIQLWAKMAGLQISNYSNIKILDNYNVNGIGKSKWNCWDNFIEFNYNKNLYLLKRETTTPYGADVKIIIIHLGSKL